LRLAFITVSTGMLICSTAICGAAPISIGTQKQLFIDEYIVAQTDGVFPVLNQPVKHPGNPILQLPPSPRDDGYDLAVIYGNVIYDAEHRLFKMWYETCNYDERSRVVAYATSVDGIKWDLPCLRLVSYPRWQLPHCGTGEMDNNLVLDTGAGETAPGVFKDLHESDARRRYKMLYFSRGNGSPLQPAYSADDIHWKPYPAGNWIPRNDSSSPCLWDPGLGKYVAHVRHNADTPRGNERQVMQYESDDFVNWTEHGVIMKADDDDPIGHRQFYEMPWMKYENLYLGFMSVYHLLPERDKQAPLSIWEDRTDTQLTVSRDNRNWSRAGNRQTFILNSTIPGDYDYGTIYVLHRPFVLDDEIWIFYSGLSSLHWAQSRGEAFEGAVCLAKLRLDGFVSLDTGGRGTMTTKTITHTGDRLVINTDARYGSMRVELLDEDGNPIPGYTKDDCEAITDDKIRHTIRWNGSSNLKSLQGRPIALKFYMQRCRLYSFVFHPS
jgi:hypothetical protein